MIRTNAASVALKIRDFITTSHLQPGDRLPTQGELCQHLDIGLRPLREGLSILGQQGLIETRRKGGTRVRKPSVETLSEPIAWHLETKGATFEDMVRARAAIESAIAAEAARNRTARDLLLMLDAIERYERQTESCPEAEAADEALHQAILGATHNPVMTVFGQLIAGQFTQKLQENLCTPMERQRESLVEHKAIYQSIEKQQPETARKLIYEHILRLLEEKK